MLNEKPPADEVSTFVQIGPDEFCTFVQIGPDEFSCSRHPAGIRRIYLPSSRCAKLQSIWPLLSRVGVDTAVNSNFTCLFI